MKAPNCATMSKNVVTFRQPNLIHGTLVGFCLQIHGFCLTFELYINLFVVKMLMHG